MDYIRNILNRLKASLWLVPALMSGAAALMAWFLLTSGWGWNLGDAHHWWLFSGSAGTARDLLSTLLSGIITMTALVVSITMVVLSLAAGQLGPRLIRNFIADRQIQAVLGLFSATVIYCLLVLRSINDELGADYVPHFAVTIASVLALLCLFSLLFYVHKVARSIIADTVVAQVANELESAIVHASHQRERRDHQHDESDEPATVPDHDHRQSVSVGHTGYLQLIDYDRLVKLAAKRDIVIRLNVRAGHFLLRGGPHMDVYSSVEQDPEELSEAMGHAFVLGPERSQTQDLEYSVRQLVEIAIRALSPGINDTFTAIAVINRLGAAMESASTAAHPPKRYFDEHDVLRVISPTQDFLGLLDASFNQIRQAAFNNPAVLIQMMRTFEQLAGAIDVSLHRDAMRRHVEKLVRAAEAHIEDPDDLADFNAVAEPTLEALKEDQ